MLVGDGPGHVCALSERDERERVCPFLTHDRARDVQELLAALCLGETPRSARRVVARLPLAQFFVDLGLTLTRLPYIQNVTYKT